jgi:hypothetical protein
VRRIIIRTVIGIVVLAVVVVAAGGGFYWAMTSYFNPAPPSLHYAKPASALEAQRQDLDYFRKLTALDRSFSPAARAEAERRIAMLQALASPLDHDRFRVALTEIMALADNGHSSVRPDPSVHPSELPLRVALFADGYFVMRARDVYADLLGGRVVEIDGHPIDAVIARLEKLHGGLEAFRRAYITRDLVQQGLLHGVELSPDANASIWTVELPNGERITRRVEAYPTPENEPSAYPFRWYSTDPLKGLDKGWSIFPTTQMQPVPQSDFNVAFRLVRVRGSCVAFIQLKGNVDIGEQKIQPFLKATEESLRAHPACAAIFDMRYNGGGDYTNTYHFAKVLPTLVGHLYVLTAPTTFSAAITTTAFVKQAAPDRVTILGERVGDRLAFFSEGNHGCLPNYHLCVNYQTGKHDYAHPCTDWRVCYWLNWFYPVRVKTLDPDEVITTRFAQWRAGIDPVFERAFQLASEGKDLPPRSQRMH